MAERLLERRSLGGRANLRGRAVRHLPPAVDDDDARADALDDLEDVRAEENRLALRRQLLEQFLHDRRRVGVEPVERLVEKQHVRPVNERGRDEHLLPHALRELGHALLPRVAQAEELEQLVAARQRRLRIEMVQARDELEVLGRRETVVERRRLRHVPDALLDLERVGRRCRSRRRSRGRSSARIIPVRILTVVDLPAPFGPEETENLARLNRHRQINDRELRAVLLREVLGLNHDAQNGAVAAAVTRGLS